MKNKKIPMRSCVVTREKCEKKDLIRIVRTPEGEVKIDLTGKMNGRGAYIKRELNVVEKAMKSKVLDRHLEVSVGEEIYTELLKIVSEEK